MQKSQNNKSIQRSLRMPHDIDSAVQEYADENTQGNYNQAIITIVRHSLPGLVFKQRIIDEEKVYQEIIKNLTSPQMIQRAANKALDDKPELFRDIELRKQLNMEQSE